MKQVFGSKGHGAVWRTLLNQIPPHDEFVEPFLGGGILLRKKRRAARNVGCDLDVEALDAFKSDVRGVELYNVCGIEWLRHRFGLYSFPVPGPKSMADVCVALYGGDGSRPGRIPFIYCDPPYPHSTRTSQKRYRFEFTEAQHVELLTVVRSIDALVMVSSYPNKLYDRELAGWRSFKFQGWSQKGPRTEQVWMNYPAPKLLHDWRYAGRDKRHRERIMRRVRNWQAMSRKMEPVERQAVLEALVEDGPAAGRAAMGHGLFVCCVRCETLRPQQVEKCPVCKTKRVESRLIYSGVF